MAKPKLALIPAAQGDKFYSVLPSDGVGDFDFTRNSSATRIAPTGFIQEVGAFGSELVTNGNFNNDSDWSKETGWTISGGKASYNGSASNNAIYQTISVTSGKIYKLSFTVVNYVSGTLIGNISTGATAGGTGNITANGDYSFNITASGQLCIFRSTSSFNGSIDNISVVEVVGNKSRLNYDLLNGKVVNCPHYLLEPASTNLVTYSEDFSNAAWTKSNTTVNTDVSTSPNGGLNADKLIPNNSTDLSSISNYALFYLSKAASAIEYTYSVFVKENGLNEILIIAQGNSVSNNASATFSLADGIVKIAALSAGNFSGASTSIDNYGNGFYRLNLTFTTNTDTNLNIRNIPTDSTITTGNGVNGISIWGAQLEEGSYPTSYIPTTGTAITRAAETADGSGDAATFNDSEGVLMAETSALDSESTNKMITISNGSSSTRILIRYVGTTLLAQLRISGANQYEFSYNPTNIKDNFKIALKYKANDFSFFVNGFELDSSNSGSTFSDGTLTELAFDDGGGANDFYGKTRELQYFDSVLTDSQLETLTSWTSLQEMITSQLYTNY
jgi:hypothetical protein